MKINQELFSLNYNDLNKWAVKFGTNLILAVLIFVVGFWLANFLSKTVRKVLQRSHIDEGLVTFLTSLTTIAFKILVFVTGVTQLGIEMTSFVALLGAAGLAVGMAFSGTLSNFAGGVMILFFKPFKVGDTILCQGAQGTVKEIQIFNTHLYTSDNKVIILPNGPLANGNITNFTRAENRRIDLVFSIPFGDDIEEVKLLMQSYFESEEKILKDPSPFVGVGAVLLSSIEVHVRTWVDTESYNSVVYSMNEYVYKQFLSKGINTLNSSASTVNN